VPGRRIPLPKLAKFQAPVALYQPLGDDDDLDEGGRTVKRKGKSKQKQADVEEMEEVDDRLYCICKSRYDANVDVSSVFRCQSFATHVTDSILFLPPQRAMIACDK
jgi:hypothetical protein